MKNLWWFVLLSFLLSSCAQFTRLESGKTIGKRNKRVSTYVSYFSFQGQDNIQLPYAHIAFEYGISDKLDAGLSISSAFNTLINAKYQMIGDQDSKFALSLNPGAEVQFANQEEVAFVRPHFSLPMSYDLNDKFSLLLEPKYVYQPIDGTHFPGLTGGLQVALKNNWTFGLGASSFYPIEENVDDASLFQFGISVKKLIVR